MDVNPEMWGVKEAEHDNPGHQDEGCPEGGCNDHNNGNGSDKKEGKVNPSLPMKENPIKENGNSTDDNNNSTKEEEPEKTTVEDGNSADENDKSIKKEEPNKTTEENEISPDTENDLPLSNSNEN